ncbi:MAG: hypothetical protein H6838_19860 [Planctomycetes bacterium]|nr:hypothetical protein [Planctomycetota bacterium]
MMKKAPAWGQRAIAQLHWVYDEWFVVREKYQNCLEGMGVGCREVVDRQGREIAGVVQLVVDREVQVDLGGLIQEESECCECRRKKFLPVTVGMGPTVVAPARGVNICKSSAWFGSGGQAFQLSIVSQAFRKAVMDCGIRGVSFRPLAVSSA